MSVTNSCFGFSDLNNNLINLDLIKGFICVFWNIRSLEVHVDEVRALLMTKNIDLLCLSETWLKPKHYDFEFIVDDYNFWRCDRKTRNGGGVAMFVRTSKKIVIEVLDNFEDNFYQSLRLKVTLKETKPFEVIAVYRPPNTSSESDNKFLEYLQPITENDVILGGDMNKDFNQSSDRMFKQLHSLGLNQVVRSHTRITATSETTIDHIYVKSDEMVYDFGVLNIEATDHKPVFISRKKGKFKKILIKAQLRSDFGINLTKVKQRYLVMICSQTCEALKISMNVSKFFIQEFGN